MLTWFSCLLFQCIPSELAKGVLGDVENLPAKRLDELLDVFLEDFKEGRLESKGWPPVYMVP